ncbi:hypothetical protein FQN52_007131 [Onygenales sp. PD_12]|nr:hypothetical protein FQN53_001051 [Emmonsiellopsis sp. PD_33]KAK2787640.1 hypothetical protein FQN52_007131 [Onygenales sp. PD_12]
MSLRTTPDFPMDVLSASTFPEPASSYPAPTNDKETGHVLYGGLPFYDENDNYHGNTSVAESMSRSASENQTATSKKKAKTSPGSSEEDAAKRRGRPRLNTRDKTAAERRRTQIRLAQRAYRLRKEATISSLNQRVVELEETVDEMSKSFLAFNDEAMSSGLLSAQPEFADHLRRVTERFLSLAKDASSPSSDREGGNLEIVDHRHETPETYLSRQPSSANVHVPDRGNMTFGYEVTSYSNRAEFGMAVTSQDNQAMFYPQRPTVPTSSYGIGQNHDWMFVDPSPSGTTTIADPNIAYFPKVLPPLSTPSPYTFSFQEPPFTRRLHRTCLGTGYHILRNSSANSQALTTAFRLALHYSSRKQLIQNFRLLLLRGPKDTLEFWEKPFFSIGGAGTHYPRRDHEGRLTYPPNMLSTERVFGSLLIRNAETPHQGKSLEEITEELGFRGQWFDSNDVDGYLRSRGIVIEDNSSIVQIPPTFPNCISPRNAPQQPATIEFGDPVTSPTTINPPAPLGAAEQTQPNELLLARLIPRLFPKTDQPTEDIMGDSSPQLPGSTGEHGLENPASISNIDPHKLPPDKQMPKTASSSLDVERFINQLVMRGVCLGRAPGFRRHDVDAALVSSVLAY